MPYSLNITSTDQSAEWEGEGSAPNTPRRRFSISTPGELGCLTLSPGRSTSQSEQYLVRDRELRTRKSCHYGTINPSRIARLVHDSARRKSGSPYRDLEDSESRLGVLGGGEGFWVRGVDSKPGATGVDYCTGLENFDPGGVPYESGKQTSPRATQRLLVVANRLPVSAIRKPDNSWTLELSAGGLVSALLGVRQNSETRWIGWPGVNVNDEKGRKSLSIALEEKGCIPVFLDEDTLDQYYNGYCNNVLWPLFHYIGLPQEDRLAATHSLQSQFEAYRRANSLFADVVFSQYQEGDIVWCHDYHLMCLPKCLKQLNNNMKVGWFLHTPFPSSEIYRTLPLRTELLKAVLTADLIGFHTYDYARHFVSACTRILGLEGTPEGVEDQGRLTRVAAFPIGIDPQRFIQALETEEVKSNIRDLQTRFAGKKVMLGVDRLDMIKGIPQKLLAYEQFLEDNIEWRDKVLLVQIAVPTRTDVHEYQRLASQVHEIVGRINGRFGKIAHFPISYLDCSLPFTELCSLYAVADVVLVTSLRDGMNLVSYEFVACQNFKKGVLILSEFAGAAQSLGAGAILVNPWNINEVAASIQDALTMKDEEREERHRHIYSHVTTHTAQSWADTFVSELNETVVEAELRTKSTPPELPVKLAVEKFRQSQNRLLILGFNSTMTAHVEDPGRKGCDQIQEMKLQAHSSLKEVLKLLSGDPKTTVLLLSGSAQYVLDEAFGEFDMWLAAENGMFLRYTKGGDWMTTMPEHLNLDWFESVKPVFDYFQERTPRSYVELRETSLVWNYKYADGEFGRVQARDMLQHLWTGPISNAAVDVVQGSKSVEVRPVGVSKGAAIDRILTEIFHTKHMTHRFDYVIVLGHFLPKDEDIYTYFDPDRHVEKECCINRKAENKLFGERRPPAKASERLAAKGGSKLAASRAKQFPLSSSPDHSGWPGRSSGTKDRKTDTPAVEEAGTLDPGSCIVDLKVGSYFSCTVGRKCSVARYSLKAPDDVISLLREMAFSDISAVQSSPAPILSRTVPAAQAFHVVESVS